MAENSRVPTKSSRVREHEGHVGGSARQIFLWWELHCLPSKNSKIVSIFGWNVRHADHSVHPLPLKSMVHLAGSPSGQINKTHYSSTQRGKYKHVPNIKSLACGMTAVYETVDVQTWKYASECFLDFIHCTVKTEGPGANKWNAEINKSDNIWKYMAQFIFIVATNWQPIWIISTFCRGETITCGLTLEPLKLKMTTLSILWPKDVENTRIAILVKMTPFPRCISSILFFKV